MTIPFGCLDRNGPEFRFVGLQTGLLWLARDIGPDTFRNNALAVTDLATCFDRPTILATSFADGSDGPILLAPKAMFPDVPLIACPGQINPWDNEEFVRVISITGRRQLIVACLATEVCVPFPALSAIAEGCDAFLCPMRAGGSARSPVTRPGIACPRTVRS
jgi:nicotinamidase-related amidase